MKIHEIYESDSFAIDCTGDACVGDTIKFKEAVFGGSFKKPKYLGDREITAKIIKDSYGADKQQHTFTLIISSSGTDPLTSGTTRKGRNVYKNGTHRIKWDNEDDGLKSLDDKHDRSDITRAERDKRKNNI